MSTILALATDAADELSLYRPATLFQTDDEADTTERKLLRMVTRTCQTLAASYDWSILKARHTWTGTASEAQSSGLPADYLRMMLNTAWDATLNRPLLGPLSDAEWAEAKSSVVSRLDPAFTIQGSQLLMNPVPPAGHTYGFGYIRNAIGLNTSQTRIAKFTANTDALLWDDELVTVGIIYHFRKIERLDYRQDELDFQKLMKDRIKADGGGRIIRMGCGGTGDVVGRMKRGDVSFAT